MASAYSVRSLVSSCSLPSERSQEKRSFPQSPSSIPASLGHSTGKTRSFGLRKATDDEPRWSATDGSSSVLSGQTLHQMDTITKSTNITWHKCSVGKLNRQELLRQKGCVIWITGLSGSGKSSLACALSHALFLKGKLTYILDGDNVRHGLCRDLSFKVEDRTENIRRIGEVAKLFADAGVICIASVISPYQKDRDACRALLPKGDFIEVFMDVPLQICEERDPKGLYKLARAGKIKGFTGVDDPYEPPTSCELVLKCNRKDSLSPIDMAETVTAYLDENGYLQA